MTQGQMQQCLTCGGLIPEPNVNYGYAGKICYCPEPPGRYRRRAGEVVIQDNAKPDEACGADRNQTAVEKSVGQLPAQAGAESGSRPQVTPGISSTQMVEQLADEYALRAIPNTFMTSLTRDSMKLNGTAQALTKAFKAGYAAAGTTPADYREMRQALDDCYSALNAWWDGERLDAGIEAALKRAESVLTNDVTRNDSHSCSSDLGGCDSECVKRAYAAQDACETHPEQFSEQFKKSCKKACNE